MLVMSYNGVEYRGVKSLADGCGVSVSVLARILRNVGSGKGSLEEAVANERAKAEKMQDAEDAANNDFCSLADKRYPNLDAMCASYGMPKDVVVSRLTNGRSISVALLTPLSINRPCVDHLGNAFDCVADMIEFHEVSVGDYEYNCLIGESLDIALMPITIKAKAIDHLDNVYNSLKDMCDAYGVSIQSVVSKVNWLGWDIREALLCDSAEECAHASDVSADGVKPRILNWLREIRYNTEPVQYKVLKSRYKNAVKIHREAGAVLDHIGNEFRTIAEMAKFYGIVASTLKERLLSGVPLEEALTQHRLQEVCDHNGEVYKSLKEMTAYYGVSATTFESRIYKYNDLKLALTKGKIDKNDVPVAEDHLGNLYANWGKMCKSYGKTGSQVRYSMLNGDTLQVALTSKERTKIKEKSRGECTDPSGRTFKSKKDMILGNGVLERTFYTRVQDGWSEEEALDGKRKGSVTTKEKEHTGKECKDHLGNTFESVSSMARHYNITPSKLSGRIKNGWGIKDALTLTDKESTRKRKCIYFDALGNGFTSATQVAKWYKADYRLVSSRLRRGCTVEEAVEPIGEKKALKAANPTGLYTNVLNPSFELDAWDDTIKKAEEEARETEETALRDGIDIYKKHKYFDKFGNGFTSVMQLSKWYNADYKLVSSRLRRGKSVDEAVKPIEVKSIKNGEAAVPQIDPITGKKYKYFDHMGVGFTSVLQLAKWHNANYKLVSGRLRRGWSVDQALSGAGRNENTNTDKED